MCSFMVNKSVMVEIKKRKIPFKYRTFYRTYRIMWIGVKSEHPVSMWFVIFFRLDDGTARLFWTFFFSLAYFIFFVQFNLWTIIILHHILNTKTISYLNLFGMSDFCLNVLKSFSFIQFNFMMIICAHVSQFHERF